MIWLRSNPLCVFRDNARRLNPLHVFRDNASVSGEAGSLPLYHMLLRLARLSASAAAAADSAQQKMQRQTCARDKFLLKGGRECASSTCHDRLQSTFQVCCRAPPAVDAERSRVHFSARTFPGQPINASDCLVGAHKDGLVLAGILKVCSSIFGAWGRVSRSFFANLGLDAMDHLVVVALSS